MDPKNYSANAGDLSFALTFTSLSLILLAFFIVLQTMSTTNRAKTEQVLQSLEPYFPQQAKSGENLIPPSRKLQEQVFLSLETFADARSIEHSRIGNSFYLSTEVQDIFEPLSSDIKAYSLETFRQLAEDLVGKNINLNIAVFSKRSEPVEWELAIARAASLYRLFADFGVDKHLLSANGQMGTRAKDPEFSPVIPGEIILTFKPAPK